MNNQGKQLEVRLYGRKVGTLRPMPRNGLVFQYDKNYIESPEAVPLGTRSALNERPWTPTLTRTWFEGLLPEGARRATLAQALGTVNVDTWTLLELAGDECAGAVQVVAPDHTENPRLFELDDDTLETLLQPPTTPFPEHHRAARLSLAGAQEKIVLVREPDGQWSLPVDGHPSTHILKPPHPEFPGLVHNEHWCMEVTRHAGIETARTTSRAHSEQGRARGPEVRPDKGPDRSPEAHPPTGPGAGPGKPHEIPGRGLPQHLQPCRRARRRTVGALRTESS